MRNTPLGFIRQQGFAVARTNHRLYTALMFQPRVIGLLVLTGTLLQTPWLFLALSAVLWLSAIAPTWNPFNTVYNQLFAHRRGRPPLVGAPAPRRFAMAVAAALTFVIGTALGAGATKTAWTFEGLFLAAVTAIIFARFCTGSYLYAVLWRQTPATGERARAAAGQRC